MMTKTRNLLLAACAAALLLGPALAGCDREAPLAPAGDPAVTTLADKAAPEIDVQTGDTAPSGLVTVQVAGHDLTFWPYTGTRFDGVPVDPINVVFAGKADPLQIRAALLALPPMEPFYAPWTDAVDGDVQTTYVQDGNGWVGSVVQLTLGEIGPVRVHLRLFRTGVPFGDGCWTLGGAHFELQIPGTGNHEVLSWELAEQVVLRDLARTGLLDASTPYLPTGPINAAPTYRTISAVIYNLLPPELVGLILGPSQPVTDDVPIPSDGQGTVLMLADAAAVVPGTFTRTVTVDYDQIVPKPLCADGPWDYISIVGPVTFAVTAAVDEEGSYSVHSTYRGALTITPYGVPDAPSSVAQVQGDQSGFMQLGNSRISSRDLRLILPPGGVEKQVSHLIVPEHGQKTSREMLRCLDE